MIQKEFQLFAAKNVETLRLYSRTSRFVFNKQVEVRKEHLPYVEDGSLPWILGYYSLVGE